MAWEISKRRREAGKNAFELPPEIASIISCPGDEIPAVLKDFGLVPLEKDEETGVVKLWRYGGRMRPDRGDGETRHCNGKEIRGHVVFEDNKKYLIRKVLFENVEIMILKKDVNGILKKDVSTKYTDEKDNKKNFSVSAGGAFKYFIDLVGDKKNEVTGDTCKLTEEQAKAILETNPARKDSNCLRYQILSLLI